MRHLHIMRCVPLLLVLVGASTAIHAMEVAPGLDIGGYGEAFARLAEHEANSPHHSPTTQVGETDQVADFTADAQFKMAYRTDRWGLRVDVLIYSEPPFADSSNNVLLEQCYVEFHQNEWLTWRGGRFEITWLGWEGFHTTELWRVNQSAAWQWNTQNHSLMPNRAFVADGVGAITHTSDERWQAEFYIVNDVLGNPDDKAGTDKAIGSALSTKIPGYGRVELGMAYDPRSTFAGVGEGSAHATAVDLNTDCSAFRAEYGWFFAAEVQFNHHPSLTVNNEVYGNDLVALMMANYAFTPDMSGTIMVDGVDRGTHAEDNEVLEVALALLTQPDKQVIFNSEVFYWAETADQADQWGASAVVAVILP